MGAAPALLAGNDEKFSDQIMEIFDKDQLPSLNETPACISQIIDYGGKGSQCLQEKLLKVGQNLMMESRVKNFLWNYSAQ